MKKRVIVFGLTILLTLSGCANKNNDSQKISSSSEKSSKSAVTSTSKSNTKIDISGQFYSENGDLAQVNQIGQNQWQMKYNTTDGEVIATFKTKWKQINANSTSTTSMRKSDGSDGFMISVTYVNSTNITIKMSDGIEQHQMIFTKEKPQVTNQYDAVLDGDLSSFAGQFSNDKFNQVIADSGFTYGGYTPEDYFNNRTTVFPNISETGYWNGIASHGNYQLKSEDPPQKIDGYYKVNVYGVNTGANGAKLTFFLVPPAVKGPDGTTSSDKRVFEVYADGQPHLLEYQQPNWWEEYQN